MASIITIKITPNEDGRAIIRLYGQDIDVTDRADKNGKGSIHFAGDDYHFEIIKGATKKCPKKVAENVEIKGFNSDGTVVAEVDDEKEVILTPADEETTAIIETLKEERDVADE